MTYFIDPSSQVLHLIYKLIHFFAQTLKNILCKEGCIEFLGENAYSFVCEEVVGERMGVVGQFAVERINTLWSEHMDD